VLLRKIEWRAKWYNSDSLWAAICFFLGMRYQTCELNNVGVPTFGRRPDTITASREMLLADDQNLLHRTDNDLTVTGRSRASLPYRNRIVARRLLYYALIWK